MRTLRIARINGARANLLIESVSLEARTDLMAHFFKKFSVLAKTNALGEICEGCIEPILNHLLRAILIPKLADWRWAVDFRFPIIGHSRQENCAEQGDTPQSLWGERLQSIQIYLMDANSANPRRTNHKSGAGIRERPPFVRMK
jgi:hypothetical protein